MNLLLQRLRLVPIVLFAAAGLFLLKVAGIIIDGGYTLGAGHQAKNDRMLREQPTVITRPAQTAERPESARKLSWAQEMFGFPEVTGSVGSPEPQDNPPAAKPAEAKTIQKPQARVAQNGTRIQRDVPPPISPAERALLERLSERRAELEKRQSELDMRDTLLKAAEKKLEERLNELKEAEARIVAATQHKEETEIQRLKNLVAMYENMKAKDAAKIFDRLDVKLATEVAKLMHPRRMSEILAQMTPEAAQKLTVSLAEEARSQPAAQTRMQELPKIEGRPRGS